LREALGAASIAAPQRSLVSRVTSAEPRDVGALRRLGQQIWRHPNTNDWIGVMAHLLRAFMRHPKGSASRTAIPVDIGTGSATRRAERSAGHGAVAAAATVGWGEDQLAELREIVATLQSVNGWYRSRGGDKRRRERERGAAAAGGLRPPAGARARYARRVDNIALPHWLDPPPPPAESPRFLHVLARLTPSHLVLLMFLDDPGVLFDIAGVAKPSFKAGSASLEQLLEYGMPEFAGHRRRYERLSNELLAAGLVTRPLTATIMNGANLWQSCTTTLGKRFLRFLSQPDPRQ
jgi:hypothetical protein